MNRKTFRRLAALAALALALAGCTTSRYRPVETSVERMEVHEARQNVFPALMRHLATQRGYPFAKLYFTGEYLYAGVKATEDESAYVFLLQSRTRRPADWKHVPLSPYVYVMFSFLDNPRLVMEKNTMPLATHSDDGDGAFRGVYKLTIVNAQYCSGETKEIPSLEGGVMEIHGQGKIIRRSMRGEQLKYYTPTYCQGITVKAAYPAMVGVRFYFDTQEDMESFASLLAGAFPRVRLP
jgi:hypothetical protein